jgi:hypothetical protein
MEQNQETEGIGGWNVTGQSNIKVLEGNWRVSFETGAPTRLPHKEVQFSCLLVWYSKAI